MQHSQHYKFDFAFSWAVEIVALLSPAENLFQKQLSGDFLNRFFNFSKFSGNLAFQKEQADLEIFNSDNLAGTS